MFSSTIRSVVMAASLLSTLGASAGAQTAEIRYHPYEIATTEGQRAVLTRIVRAAKRACEPDRTMTSYIESKICVAELTAEMVSNSNSPALAGMWKGGNVQMASRSR